MTPSWGTEVVPLADSREGGIWAPVPGDFSAAVTLVVTITLESLAPPYLQAGWNLTDSIDGERWWNVADTDGLYEKRFNLSQATGVMHSTARFVVPFGPHLGVSVSQYGASDHDKAFRDATAKLFWRKL